MIIFAKTKFIARIVVVATGLLLICFGVWQGELAAILRKAVVICMECIGIG